LEAGSYQATSTIEAFDSQSNPAQNSPQKISVNLTVITQKAISPLSVVINEIAWMGTKAFANDEWIELYNNTNEKINLNGWTINWGEGTSTHSINLIGDISPYSFYLLERTASTTTNVEEDQIYTGALKNSGEKLELQDLNSNLIDIVDCLNEWFAGDNDTKHTMERINPSVSGNDSGNWATYNGTTTYGLDAGGNPIYGTPKAKNSVFSTSPPNPVSGFAIDKENSRYNRVALTWSTTTDPDTPEGGISYFIYYSKEGEITTSSVATADSTSTASTTITISDLSYDSTYYFGIKAFDGENYSPLATTTPYNTPLAPITDLNAGTSAIREAIDLFWTSNGAKYYIIKKYAEKEIVENATHSENQISWKDANFVATSSATTTGKIETFVVKNLDSEEIYYFAIKSINQTNATSEISNSPKAKAIPGFQDNGDGTITDLHTGLVWVKDGTGAGANNGQPLTWNEAINFCNNLVLCQDGAFTTTTFGTTTCSEYGEVKYHDWRLPNIKELASIIHYSKNAPTIDENYFTNTLSGKYWSSSMLRLTPEASTYGDRWEVYSVDFSNGKIEYSRWGRGNPPSQSPSYYIRPVRGPDNSDVLPITGMTESIKERDDGYFQKGCFDFSTTSQTITDHCTSLMWSKEKIKLSWDQAIKHVQNATTAGYQDWRLPNIGELINIANFDKEAGIIFQKGPVYGGGYWSSTKESNSKKYWNIDFGPGTYVGLSGTTNTIPTDYTPYTRAIRNTK